MLVKDGRSGVPDPKVLDNAEAEDDNEHDAKDEVDDLDALAKDELSDDYSCSPPVCGTESLKRGHRSDLSPGVAYSGAPSWHSEEEPSVSVDSKVFREGSIQLSSQSSVASPNDLRCSSDVLGFRKFFSLLRI